MCRAEVYSALDSERAYQDAMTASEDRPDMVEINLAAGILAMEELLHQARVAWYYGAGNQPEAMSLLRKVGGLVVKMGEQYGLPQREGF